MIRKNNAFFCFSLLLIIAAITMYGCKTDKTNTDELVEVNFIADDGKSFPVSFRGTWRKENFANTITFTQNTLKASNQSYTWHFQSVSNDVYIIKPDNTKYTGKLTIKLIKGNLEISGDSSPNYENNWNGTWKKVN